ncbi:MAG: extracellular solute-binding protein [Lachnospiraceae bacterium]|nr:extracellular solute-binding protein [Lachnospiraceae bacterium]
MKYGKRLIAMGLVAVFALSGCGNTNTDKGETKEEMTTEATDTTAEGTEAADGETLVVYSPQGDETRGAWMMEKAKADLGIDIQFLCAGGGELSDRLVAEKANPQADVVMGLAQNSMYTLKDKGILQPYEPTWVTDLPEVYKEKESYFNSFWQTPIVIAYNSDYISQEDAPKSWADLADEKYAGKYGIGGTSSQTTRSYLVGLLWDYVDQSTGEVSQEGWDLLSSIYANAGTMPSNDPDIWKAFKEGEMPILLWWYGGVVSNCEKNEIPVEYVKPENGTPVVAEAIGMVAGTKREDAAKKFIDWFGSAEVMSAYAEEFGQAPASPVAIELCPDAVKEAATMFTAQNIDWSIASKNIDSWLEKIELEIMP